MTCSPVLMASPRIRPAPRNVESSSRSLSNCRPQISRWVVASKDAPWRPTRTDDILFLVHLQQQQQKICLNKKTAVRTCAFRRKSIEVRGDAQVNKGCAVLSSFLETPLITPLFFPRMWKWFPFTICSAGNVYPTRLRLFWIVSLQYFEFQVRFKVRLG